MYGTESTTSSQYNTQLLPHKQVYVQTHCHIWNIGPGLVPLLPLPTFWLHVTEKLGRSVRMRMYGCSILPIIHFRALWSMRNYIHINLCISLMAAQLTFIAGVEPRGSVVSTP